MLSNLQEILERSIFEKIRQILVGEGYLPDITDEVRYPRNPNGSFTAIANANWEADLTTIRNTKGFAIELFNYSSPDAKGTKKVPRIVIETDRSMPSELGAPAAAYTLVDPDNDEQFLKQPLPYKASTFYFNVHLVGNTSRQMRILNAVLAKALDNVKYIPYYTEPTQLFFIQQTGYFEVPGQQEGLEEKVYQFEVPDLFEISEEVYAVSKMKIIDVYIQPQLPDEEPDLSIDQPPGTDSIHVDDVGTDFT